MEYLSGVLGALLSPLFILFIILVAGYAIGAIHVKGVSLGSAGVLLVGIIVGVLFSYVDSFQVGEATITL